MGRIGFALGLFFSAASLSCPSGLVFEKIGSDSRYRRWTGKLGATLDAPTPLPSALVAHRAWARAALAPESLNPKALLRRQRAFFGIYPDIVYNIDRLLADAVGVFRVPSCLEILLTTAHFERHPPQASPTEFQAFLLRHPRRGERIYFASGGSVSPPSHLPLVEWALRDLADEWVLDLHLHNHPFFVAHLPDGDVAGTLGPSDGDIVTYLEDFRPLALRRIAITNGIDTFTASVDDIKKLRCTHCSKL